MRAVGAPILLGFVTLLVGASQARGQVSIREHELSRSTFNAADCTTEKTVRLTRELFLENGTERVFLMQERVQDRLVKAGTVLCPPPKIEGREVLPEEELVFVGSTVLDDVDLSPVDILGQEACDEGARETDVALCLYVLDRARNLIQSDAIPLDFDTAVPARPVIAQAAPGDERAVLMVSGLDPSAGDVFDFLVQFRPCTALDAGPAPDAGTANDAGTAEAGEEVEAESICGAPGPFRQVEIESSLVEGGELVLHGLVNDVEYEVRVIARDDFGNVSEPSEPVLVTPDEELTPLDLYEGRGSPFSWDPSCAQGGGVAFGGLTLLLLGLLARRRRSFCGALLGVVLLATIVAAPQAKAYPGQLSLSVFVGPYAPAIDTERVGGQRIFPIWKCFFDDAQVPELGGDVAVHLLDLAGSLELGVGLSAMQGQGKTQPLETASPASRSRGQCGEPGTGRVELSVLKLRPFLQYRFNVLLDAFGFPLVPYGRAGLVGAGYAWTREGELDQGGTGRATDPVGVVFGYELVGGLQLALDFLDQLDPFTPNTARRARAAGTFEHAFLFAEALYQPIHNFGTPGLVLSPEDRFFELGAPWTFHVGLALELP